MRTRLLRVCPYERFTKCIRQEALSARVTNAAALYTEQANLIADLGPGGGVYMSTDGGTSWTFNPVDPSQGQFDVVLGLAAVSSKVGPPSPPTISTNGVVSGASYPPGVVPNSWVTILGTNLASKTDDWTKSIVNGESPMAVDGVSVTIGGKAAYINYFSPVQMNLLAPDVGFCPLPLTVTTSGGTSGTFTVTSNQYGPAFFEWPNAQPVATRQDFSYAVENGRFSCVTTVPAKPGDVIILWGTGFGPTSPVAPPGAPVPSDTTYSTAALPDVTTNNDPVTLYGAAFAQRHKSNPRDRVSPTESATAGARHQCREQDLVARVRSVPRCHSAMDGLQNALGSARAHIVGINAGARPCKHCQGQKCGSGSSPAPDRRQRVRLGVPFWVPDPQVHPGSCGLAT
jgi:uncharacterized protein (TIGR03437 family)